MDNRLFFHHAMLRSFLLAVPLILGAAGIVAVTHLANVARAEVRITTPQEQFKSGGERSETVLIEISATLKRIDARLERIEKAFVQSAEGGNR